MSSIRCLLRRSHVKHFQLTVDLEKQQIILPDGERLEFELDMFRKKCLLQGLDDIGLTLDKAELIRAYERATREDCPWLFEDLCKLYW